MIESPVDLILFNLELQSLQLGAIAEGSGNRLFQSHHDLPHPGPVGGNEGKVPDTVLRIGRQQPLERVLGIDDLDFRLDQTLFTARDFGLRAGDLNGRHHANVHPLAIVPMLNNGQLHRLALGLIILDGVNQLPILVLYLLQHFRHPLLEGRVADLGVEIGELELTSSGGLPEAPPQRLAEGNAEGGIKAGVDEAEGAVGVLPVVVEEDRERTAASHVLLQAGIENKAVEGVHLDTATRIQRAGSRNLRVAESHTEKQRRIEKSLHLDDVFAVQLFVVIFDGYFKVVG